MKKNKFIVRNINDCRELLDSLENKNNELLNNTLNKMDLKSKVIFLRYCLERRDNARKDSEKSI